ALFVFIPLTDADTARFQRTNIHVVQLNNCSHLGQSVSIDDYGAAYDATTKLITFGHRAIGFVLPNDVVDQVWRDRLQGYIKALEDNGIKYDGSCIGNESTFVPLQAGLVTRE